MREFDKIIGYESVKAELERICDIMTDYDKYRNLGVATPRGLLLYGNPGVGKTLMANCLIKESNRKTFTCRKDRPDGDFINYIKKVFEDAKENAPSIVLLDDMDKFANQDEYHRNAEEFVTVQSCIDDCKNYEVFVLATANDLRALPKSLLRTGRFDKSIRVDNPQGEDAEKIIKHYLANKKIVEDIDSKLIARILNGGSCADLETVINEAGINAGHANKAIIETEDVIRAAMRVIFGAPENLQGIDDESLRRIAYHEAGHAVVAEALEPDSVCIVSVLSHIGETGGVTAYYQDDKYWISKKYMENRVISLLGGKAATEIVYGEVDVGANNDLHRAFNIVERFADDYCSNSFDRRQLGDPGSNDLQSRREMQISVEIENYYWTAKKIIVENKDFLDRLANALVENKTLIFSQIKKLKQ